MRRIVAFIFIIAAVLALAGTPGSARIVWHDYVIETSAAFLLLGVLGTALALYMLLRLWDLIRNGPALWRLRRQHNRFRQGHEHLTDGLVAVAGGNAAEAGRFAVGARKLLGTTPATRLLQAQAAQLAGDHKAAREIFLALAADPDSAVLGYRGLIMEALRAGDIEDAGRLAEKLRRVRPETPWLNLVHFELAARRQAWGEAELALGHVINARLMDPATAKRHQAAALLAEARDESRQGQHEKALPLAERALRIMPGWAPAVLALARAQTATGHKRVAQRLIERFWPETVQHPELASLYRSKDGDSVDAYRRLERLCRGQEDKPASRMALAEAAAEADIWGEARRHAQALIASGQATQSAYRLMAGLEHRESGDEQAALRWLAKAADAPPDPVWLCRACGGGHNEWLPVCRFCGRFDTLEWQTPGQSRAVSDSVPALLLTTNWID